VGGTDYWLAVKGEMEGSGLLLLRSIFPWFELGCLFSINITMSSSHPGVSQAPCIFFLLYQQLR
jgi:hypothetical protein